MEIPGYRIEKEIGKGGMATVYLAVQESLDRSVVLKVLDKVQSSTADDMTTRFIDEGRIVASLRHPNIVTIFDIGLAGDELYISMEYVHGGDLKKRMESHVAPKIALDIVGKVGSALASAHAHNVIHRDVKPANILFRDDDTPLLTDFASPNKQTRTPTLPLQEFFWVVQIMSVLNRLMEGRLMDDRISIVWVVYSMRC